MSSSAAIGPLTSASPSFRAGDAAGAGLDLEPGQLRGLVRLDMGRLAMPAASQAAWSRAILASTLSRSITTARRAAGDLGGEWGGGRLVDSRRHGGGNAGLREIGHGRTLTMASISTVMLLGSEPMPTAERAWRPALAEHRDEEVRAAIDDLGMIGEIAGRH